ncbi:MAG: hypothetical protein HKN87_23470 [Saprospiraceae bacterium]|nr:hypothetical protein [Saprospiraceae bacterium]
MIQNMKILACFFLVLATLPVPGQDMDALILDERHTGRHLVQKIQIDSVWSGHPVRFALLTHLDRQYIAYYNAQRVITVGQRFLVEDAFELNTLPRKERLEKSGTSTVVEWDSHNSLTLAIDKEGYLHLAGNMHVNGLTYFRSTKAYDITTIEQVIKMTGAQEDRCTYPRFLNTQDGQLVFHYRDGGSGNGNEIYNIYNCAGKSWSRLLDVPLTDGQGKMNAYASGPRWGSDGWYHLYWVWRDTPDCATNHDLSYMKSKDLKNWIDVNGRAITLPATIDQTPLIVDPIPPHGGIINLAAKLALDDDHNPIFVYHKYDEDGSLQLYMAHHHRAKWNISQLTNWDYRWEFSGRGSINSEFILHDFTKRADGYYLIRFWHIKYGERNLLLNQDLEPIGKILPPDNPRILEDVDGDFPGLLVQTSADTGQSLFSEKTYILKWETLNRNRDRPRPKPWPSPSTLYLLTFSE